jgi:hypothetical protein
MKPSFEKRLHTYRDIAKEQLRLKEEHATDERLAAVLGWNLEQAADATGTSKDTQRGIFRIQRTKQLIMQSLRTRLRGIDEDAKETGPDLRDVVADGDRFACRMEDGKRRHLTLGELMTDGDWGVRYALDPKTVPRNIRKRYAIEDAKRELQDRLDTQIAIQESRSTRTHEFKQKAYEAILEKRTEGTDMLQSGLVAERMVKNLLKKISIDLGADFKIVDVDVYQDVENKIDFVVRRTQAERGVDVQADDAHVGIQFTINPTRHAQHHKEKQIAKAKQNLQPGDRVKDIVLVAIPLDDVLERYGAWKKRRTPGGPDALWDAETKRKILRGVLHGFIPDEEIERTCGKIEDTK